MRTIRLKCDLCGAEKIIERRHYNKHKHHFCSSECMHKWLSSNVDTYGIGVELFPIIRGMIGKRYENQTDIFDRIRETKKFNQHNDKYLLAQITIALRRSGYKRCSKTSKTFIKEEE